MSEDPLNSGMANAHESEAIFGTRFVQHRPRAFEPLHPNSPRGDDPGRRETAPVPVMSWGVDGSVSGSRAIGASLAAVVAPGEPPLARGE